jgi:Ca2+-binding EF-hand superfamily protein
MGCTSSKESKISGENTPAKYTDTRQSATETKLFQALLKKKMEIAISSKGVSFEKILLKFDKIRVVLGYVKQIFKEVSNNDELDHAGLQAAFRRLRVTMTLQEILDLFDFIDVQEKNNITIKEFLVALTIGMVLDVIPALQNHELEEGDGSSSTLNNHHSEINEMLNLIVAAYLIFDPDGKGYIEKSGVEGLLQEHGSKGGNAMLSQQRWNEMVRNIVYDCYSYYFVPFTH